MENNKKNVVMDATLLTSLMYCPRYSDFNYNLNLQQIGGKSNSLEAGSIVHKVLEVFNKSKINGLNRADSIGYGLTAGMLYITGCKHCTNFIPLEGDRCPVGSGQLQLHSWENNECIFCKGRLKPECGHPPNEYPGTPNTPQESEGYKTGWQYVLDTCEQYFEYHKNSFWVPLESEVVKSKVLYEDDEIRILWKAKFDLLADTMEAILPIDYKTMKMNRDSVSLNNQFIGQCLLAGTRKMIVDKIGFQKTLEPKDKFVQEVISYSAARLLEWQGEILPYYAKLLIMYNEMEYYPPNFSNCVGKFGLCKYKDVCESDPGMREQVLKANFYVGPVWNPINESE